MLNFYFLQYSVFYYIQFCVTIINNLILEYLFAPLSGSINQ